MNHIDVAKIKPLDGNQRIYSSDYGGRFDANDIHTPPIESFLIVLGYIRAPYCDPMPPADQLQSNLLYMLVTTPNMRPVPDVNQENM